MRQLTCCLLLLFAAGCSGGPSSQLTACQQDKEQLLATIREQRATNRALREEKESLAARLDEAEKELARSSVGTRLSSRPAERSKADAAASLPWRTPSGKVESADPRLVPKGPAPAGGETIRR